MNMDGLWFLTPSTHVQYLRLFATELTVLGVAEDTEMMP
jgi:hypothetical protein